MSKKMHRPSEEEPVRETSRRALLKRALIVLGASAIVQASGGVMTLQATPKKEGSKVHKNAKTTHKTTTKTTNKVTDKGTFKTDVKSNTNKTVGKKKKSGDTPPKGNG